MFNFLRKKTDNANYLIGAVLLIILIGFIIINKTGESTDLQGKLNKQAAQPGIPSTSTVVKQGERAKTAPTQEEIETTLSQVINEIPSVRDLIEMAQNLDELDIRGNIEENKDTKKQEYIDQICAMYGANYEGTSEEKTQKEQECLDFFANRQEVTRETVKMVMRFLAEKIVTIVKSWDPQDRDIIAKIQTAAENYEWGKVANLIVEAATKAATKVQAVREAVQSSQAYATWQEKKEAIKAAIKTGLGIDLEQEIATIQYYTAIAYVNLWIDESKFMKEYIRNRFADETKYPTTNLEELIKILETTSSDFISGTITPEEAVDTIAANGAPYMGGRDILGLYEDLKTLNDYQEQIIDLTSVLKTYGVLKASLVGSSESIKKLAETATKKIEKAQVQVDQTKLFIDGNEGENNGLISNILEPYENPDADGITPGIVPGPIKGQFVNYGTAKATSYMNQTSRDLKDAEDAVNNFIKAKITEDLESEYVRQQMEKESNL